MLPSAGGGASEAACSVFAVRRSYADSQIDIKTPAFIPAVRYHVDITFAAIFPDPCIVTQTGTGAPGGKPE